MRPAAVYSSDMFYAAEYKLGTLATDGEPCPFLIWQLGRRCTWFAGYWDARTDGFA
jgi:ribosome modulation factor